MAATSAAAAAAAAVTMKNAFNVVSFLGLYGYLNPFTACVTNNTLFDYIIVGGGTSGSVIANRLSENSNDTVLVIEGGSDFDIISAYPSNLPYVKRSSIDWNYTALPDVNFGKCHDTSEFMPTIGKVLGGDSSTDFMFYSQGTDQSYNKWAEMTGEPSWSYSNVLRLFKKLERFEDKEIKNSPDSAYHGFEGNVGLTKDRSHIIQKYSMALEQVGIKVVEDINNNTKLGVTGAIYYIADHIRQNTALAYLYPVRNRTNLFVLKNTIVDKVLIDEKKTAVGVLAITDDKRIFEFRANKEVIIAAGALNTPAILQRSGIGPKNVLDPLGIPVKSDLPVGLNYQNHVGAIVTIAAEKTKAQFVVEKYDFRNFPAATMMSYVSLNKSNTYPECLNVIFVIRTTPATQILTFTAKPIFHFDDATVDGWYKGSEGREVLYAIIQRATVDSRGEVRLRSIDPFDPPIFDPRFLSEEADIENLISCVKDYMKILKSPMLEKFGAYFVDPTKGKCGMYKSESDDFWRCYVQCLFSPLGHHVGTAAMGSVVDGRLRIKGVHKLRVSDASVISELMVGSMSVPTMMIGENTAEMIKEDNKGQE